MSMFLPTHWVSRFTKNTIVLFLLVFIHLFIYLQLINGLSFFQGMHITHHLSCQIVKQRSFYDEKEPNLVNYDEL